MLMCTTQSPKPEPLLTQRDGVHLLDKYRHIPIGIQHGFNTGVKYIANTFTLPNDESILTYHEVFQRTINHEFRIGRYNPIQARATKAPVPSNQASPPQTSKPVLAELIEGYEVNLIP